MRITSVRIRNFRGIKSLDLDLGEVTVLIGENNSGKTSVLEALGLCLREIGSRRRVVFDTLDFHLQDDAAEPSSAEPIQIDIRFSEQMKGEWSSDLVARLNRNRILQINDDDCSLVHLRVTCEYDPSERDFRQGWSFLDLSGEPLTGSAGGALSEVQREVSYFYLSALRDAARHFDARGPFWRPFLKDNQLPAEKKAEIEQKLQDVNDLVVESHSSFGQVQEGLRRVQDVVPTSEDNVVSIEAVPGRIFDMLAKAQIHLGATTGAKIPVGRHGEGTQSLAVLTLFSAFLDAWPEGAPIVALEEPEAHLHPSAIRALWLLLSGFSGQKLISTHSGDLLSEIDVLQIRRLSGTGGNVKSYFVPTGLLSPEETRKFNYHIRRGRGQLLFSRCWLLVEGESESWVYPAAARALGMNLDRNGISVVEYRQTDVGLLAKIANSLGIEWYCVGDDDTQRQNTEQVLQENLGSAKIGDRQVFPYENLEIHLLSKGYESMYDRHIPNRSKENINVPPGHPEYWAEYARLISRRSGAKTRGAADVAVEMERRGEQGVTAEIRAVLDKVISLARGA